ncbi:MAG: hypothetical protein K0S47_3130 [Herbinix sp.]|nr:hypothetical protein [Herbinix sp.]
MVSEQLKEELYYLSMASTPSEIITIWKLFDEVNKDKSLIISLNNYANKIYPNELQSAICTSDSHFIPYFETDRLYFLDNILLKEMDGNNHYNVTFPIDYSVMLDTNYSSYINNFVNNDNHFIGHNVSNEVYTSFDILLRHDYNFDHMFYIIENYINSLRSIELENSNLLTDIRQNLASLELFKNIDKNSYVNKGLIQYRITKEDAYKNADHIINEIYTSFGGKEMMEQIFLNYHKSMVLLLIGILAIRFDTKDVLPKKMDNLFNYSDTVLGLYLDREMVIACKYFSHPQDIQIINKINKGMSAEKLYKSIENIAWDFTVPRIMEFFSITIREGRFFIPFFLSNDFNLRCLLRQYKVKGLIYSKEKLNLVPIPSIYTEDYFKSKGYIVDTSYFSSVSQYKRNKIYRNNQENGFNIIKDEFKKLTYIMNCK